MGQDAVKWFEKQVTKEKNPLKALAEIGHSLNPDEGEYLEDEMTRNLRSFVTSAYSDSSTYSNMMSEFVNRCRREIKKKTTYNETLDAFLVEMVPDSLFGPPPLYWPADLASFIVDILEESIDWTRSKPIAKQIPLQNSPTKPVAQKERTQETERDTQPTTPDNVQKRVLGVLKSFPRISISELSKYSGASKDATRDMLFEMIGDNLVAGRFDPTTDEFISAHAATASREIKSDGLSLARCMYCGKSLERALISGDEVPCPSCGMVNVG